MNCPKCNNPVKAGQKFCSACGAPLPADIDLRCPKCKSSVKQGQKFCAVCGENLRQASATDRSDASYTQADKRQAASFQKVGPDSVRCPECGKMTDSLKQATLFNKLLFLGAYMQWQTVKYTCCPECMRKHISNHTLSTLVPGNLMWIVMVLPLHGYHLYKSYQQG